MVLNYQKTIIGAFRDVSNALIAVNKQRAAREQQEKLVAAAARCHPPGPHAVSGRRHQLSGSTDHRFHFVFRAIESGGRAAGGSTDSGPAL